MNKSFFVILLLIIASCNSKTNESKSELLSSISWTLEQTSSSNDGNLPSVYTFQDNGTYTLQAGEIEVNGQWEWVSENEIFLQLKGLRFDGESTQFDQKSNNYNMRVIELSDQIFKTLEKHENDDWESTFVKEITYIPQVK